MAENKIDVSDFKPQYGRSVTFPWEASYPALWLDDLTADQFNTIIAEERDATGLEIYAVLPGHIKMLVPTLSDDDFAKLSTLSVRELSGLASELKIFESMYKPEEPGPLATPSLSA